MNNDIGLTANGERPWQSGRYHNTVLERIKEEKWAAMEAEQREEMIREAARFAERLTR